MKQLAAYTREFFQLYPRKALLSVFLKLILGFSRGAGLLLLIPLLRQSGLKEKQAPVDQFLYDLFQGLGLQLTIPTILVVMLLLTCFYSILNHYAGLLDTGLVSEYTRRLKSKLAEHLIFSSWLYLKQKRDASIYSIFLNQIEIIGFACNQLIQFVGSGIMLLIYLALACIISVKMTGIALLLFLPLVLIHRVLFRKAVENGSEDLQQKQEEYLRLSSELQLIKEIKVTRSEVGVLKHLNQIFGAIFATEMKFSKIQSSSTLIFEIGAILIFACFFLFSFYWFHFPVVELILLIYLISKLMPLASSLASNYLNLMNMIPAYENYRDLLKETQEHRDVYPEDVLHLDSFDQHIQISEIEFGYPTKKRLFDRFSAEIKIGKINLIRGASGSGKSTLIELILGLMPVQSGEIKIQGKNSANYDLREYRGLLAYVPQEIQLLHASIRENILFSNSKERDVEIQKLISSCAAFHFILELPIGLDTVIGESGIQLSGGERQRIALLRALLRQPKLLIIDEGTAAMDEENEQLIFEYLQALKPMPTIVFVSHRKQLWDIAEHVIDL